MNLQIKLLFLDLSLFRLLLLFRLLTVYMLNH